MGTNAAKIGNTISTVVLRVQGQDTRKHDVVGAGTGDDFELPKAQAMRVTPALRAKLQQLAQTKDLQELAAILSSLTPRGAYLNGIDSNAGVPNDLRVSSASGNLSIINPDAPPGTVLGIFPISGDVNKFNVQTQRNAFRLRQKGESDEAYEAAIAPAPGPHQLNWIREVEVPHPNQVKILLERDAEGMFYDRGTRFQELVLDTLKDGQVWRVTIRNGDWILTRPFWNEKGVEFSGPVAIEPMVSLG